MKCVEKEKARGLRQEGKSINFIANLLHVSKSTVSIWVRDIILSDEQLAKLKKPDRSVAGRTISKIWRDRRRDSQQEGREQAKVKDWLHSAGCMLYWGEGSKGRTGCSISNSDVGVLILFKKFLEKFFNIDENSITIRIACYTDNGLSLKEIESFWLSSLVLPLSSLRQGQVNIKPISSQFKHPRAKRTILKLSSSCTPARDLITERKACFCIPLSFLALEARLRAIRARRIVSRYFRPSSVSKLI